MTTESDTGRVNQKKRTRMAIIGACRELIRSGVTVTMPDVARLALVSEATAYPAERVAFACEFLLRGVLASQTAVRAMISATIVRPEMAAARPGIRFGLIDEALAPLNDTLGATDPARFTQLKHDLAAVVSAEALFSLTDLARLTPGEAIAILVRTASTITQAALREAPAAPSEAPAASSP